MTFNTKNKYGEHYPDYGTGNEIGIMDTRHQHDYHSSSFEQQSQGSYTGHYPGETWQQEDRVHGAAPMNAELVPDYEQENIAFTSHGNRFAQYNDSYSDDNHISPRGQRLLLENLQKDRSPDEHFSRERSPEDRFPRGRSPEDRFSRERSPDNSFPRERSPEDRFPRERSPEDKFRREGSLEDGFSREKSHGKLVTKQKLPWERYNDHDATYEFENSQETMESPWFNDGNHEMSRSLVTQSQEGDRQEILYEEIDNPGFVGSDDADFQTEQEVLDVNYRSNRNNFDFLDGTQTKIFRRKSKKFLESIQGNDDISLSDGADVCDYLPSHQQKEKQPLRDKLTLLREQKSLHGVVSVYRDQIVRVPVTEATRLKAWHHRQKQSWQRFKLHARSWIYQLEPWSGALKEVEGQFGTAIMGYFRFVRWLMFLNMYICLVNICLTLVPYFALYKSPSNFTSSLIGLNTTFFQAEAVDCTHGYKEELNDVRSAGPDVFSDILHFLQGTGWMEDTVLFYGAFFNKTYLSPIHGERETYHMGLSYLLATGVSFIISFFVIVKNSSKGLKDTAVIHGATMAMYSNKVLTGWDFCISQAKAAKTKHSNISGEFKKDLEIQRFMWKMENRTTGDKIKLYLLRTVINILMVFLLGGSLYLIYLSFSQLLVLQEQFNDTTPALVFVIQYIPSVTITLLNIIVPIVFKKVVLLEDYTPSFEMIMTLLRTILLRLSSLGVLLISIYQLLQSDDPQYEYMCGNKRWSSSLASNTSTNVSAGSIIKCWETYVGQQIYKLVILDFLVLIIVTFIVELPRRLVYNTFSKRFKLIDMVGLPEVDLPKVVLDIVYAQTLCWMGLFFSPLIPFMCFLKCFIVFYVKKFTLLNNYVAPTRPYRTTHSNSLFIGMLFISFLMAAIPITYMVGNFNPSQSCGPFRVYATNHTVFFDTVAHVILEWPQEAQDVFFFLGKTNFFIPAILVMCLIMYYYWAVKEGLTKMEKMLQEQLKLEGRDKQFLLARVNEIVQHMDTGGATNG
ncbi:transmembrane channel-like protein 7 isoform X1 [Mizuhopecten yessoensis]|uniref:transmembrane channel-like protein 7 isoform X1 n=1 Tax=Mizuhopecten yessoensis TaxID=6573 RepID=UPI000B45C9DB|nr:transmembrane channel-like protein 7 isoform X1 [Mizuhopecten yessoensis]